MSEHLPLADAYPFAAARGLSAEAQAVKEMEIEWDRSYTSSLRRGYLVELLQKHNIFEEFKERYWPYGNTPAGETMVRRYVRIKSNYEDYLAGGGGDRGNAEELEEEMEQDQEFAAEADLRDFLAKNLHLIEPGLKLYQGHRGGGVEFAVDKGRIDILAVDGSGRYVVFEIKVSRGRDRTLGQILYYMAWVNQHLGSGPCRGVIVAKEVGDDLALAAKCVEGVSLFRYRMSFAVENAGP